MTSSERFEAWLEWPQSALLRRKDGTYQRPDVQFRYLGWQARDPEVRELVEALQKIIDLPWGWEGDCGAVSIAENAIANYESDGT